MTIEENVAITKTVQLILGLAKDEVELTLFSEEGQARFWDLLARSAMQWSGPRFPEYQSKPKKKEPGRMTDKEARLFGKERIPFGEFVGKQVDQIPLERLRWYSDQTFVDDLRRYLDSGRVKRESE